MNALNDADGYRSARKDFDELLRRGSSWSGHEHHCSFLNTGDGRFATISSLSGFDFGDDGRAVALTDWDRDGDLDVWTVNRTAPQVRFLRNDAGNKQNFISLTLRGVTCNRDAIGARVEVVTDVGSQFKSLRAGEGFLSQSAKTMHFGLGDSKSIKTVAVTWPGGKREQFTGITPCNRYTLIEGKGKAQPSTEPQQPAPLTAQTVAALPAQDEARIVLPARVPMPELPFERWELSATPKSSAPPSGPQLTVLWASWCAPCLAELKELQQHNADLKSRQLTIQALSVDGLQQEDSEDADEAVAQAKEYLNKIGFHHIAGRATPSALGQLELLRGALFQRQRSFPVPSSFLTDANGKLAVIYVGRVPLKQLLADVDRLKSWNQSASSAAYPFTGRWLAEQPSIPVLPIAAAFREAGFTASADKLQSQADAEQAKQLCEDGIKLAEGRLYDGAIAAFRDALKLQPEMPLAHVNLGLVLAQSGKPDEGIEHFQLALKSRPNFASAYFSWGLVLKQQGKITAACEQFQRAIELEPDDLRTRHTLALTLRDAGEETAAVETWNELLEWDPHHLPTLHHLSLLLAGGEEVRDPRRAVKVSEQACRLTGFRSPELIDALAIAYAADHQTQKAEFTAKIARDLAKQHGRRKLAEQIDLRLKSGRK